MAVTHAKQVTPTNGNEPPIVRTGGEYIIPQISSSRFIHTAKQDGVVKEIVPNKYMTVEYKDGTEISFDIIPRLSKTKMGAYISVEMNTLPVGAKFKKNQALAYSKNFSNDGVYCSGKNVFIAVMQYDGYGHEDSYTISRTLSNSMNRDVLKEINVIIPPEAKILQFNTNIGTKVENNDVLVEFTHESDLADYIELNKLDVEFTDGEEVEEVVNMFSKGQDSIKLLSQAGEIVDIKVYINNKHKLDKRVTSYHEQLVKETEHTIDKLAKNKNKQEKYQAADNINRKFMQIGGHKYNQNEFQGARIAYYIRQSKPLEEGDKLATRYGAKGVIGRILDPAPTSEDGKPIDIFISPVGVFSRKNIAMIKELYLGKVMYYLNEQVKSMAENERVKDDDIKEKILSVYRSLSNEKTTQSVEKHIGDIKPSKLRDLIKKGEFNIFFVVSPFSTVKFQNIKKAADILGIQLDEKVYLPEFDTWTKNPVPVGVTYTQALEQFAEAYSNVRSAGRYQSLTKQATRGKSAEGGQSIGALDTQALLAYEANNILAELQTLRSDQHVARREVQNNIITTGSSKMPARISGGETAGLLKTFMTGMGLLMK